LADLGGLVATGSFWVALADTLRSTFVGLLIAVAVALPLGVALGTTRWLRWLLDWTIDAARTVPPIVILPIALLVFTGGLDFKVVLVLQGSLWSLTIQTEYGARRLDPVAVDTAKAYRIGAVRRLLVFRIPAAGPVILSGLRLAASAAFGISILSELLGGEPGLGSILAVAQSANSPVRVYSVTIAAGVTGLLIAWLFGRLQRLALPWARKGHRT
jgi:ABC-type nitrate/sulfonate/bicarbonate transport system permease component